MRPKTTNNQTFHKVIMRQL